VEEGNELSEEETDDKKAAAADPADSDAQQVLGIPRFVRHVSDRVIFLVNKA
jgi:hypothetical protein